MYVESNVIVIGVCITDASGSVKTPKLSLAHLINTSMTLPLGLEEFPLRLLWAGDILLGISMFTNQFFRGGITRKICFAHSILQQLVKKITHSQQVGYGIGVVHLW